MRTQLLRPLFVLALLTGLNSLLLAQPPADCNNCACNIPSMLGATMWTSTNQPVCDPNQSVIFNQDVNKFSRFYGLTGRRYTFSLCGNTGNTIIY
ncbi:MAG: hypothetical protein M3R08_12305, partial [Bacteroidota bacterium]|nr:hypothetical protein [Bacteroidota bacterium]